MPRALTNCKILGRQDNASCHASGQLRRRRLQLPCPDHIEVSRLPAVPAGNQPKPGTYTHTLTHAVTALAGVNQYATRATEVGQGRKGALSYGYINR